MTRTVAVCLACGLLSFSSQAFAEDKPTKASDDPSKGVKPRSSVQVIENNVPVDDMISRLRRDRGGKGKSDAERATPESPSTTPDSTAVPGSAATPGSPLSKEARELRRERLRLKDEDSARERALENNTRREDKSLRERLKDRRREKLEERRDDGRPRR